MRISHKIQFIYLIIFVLFLSFSKQIVSLNFDKPITNNLHENFNTYVEGLKTNFKYTIKLRNTSDTICDEIAAGNLNRHSTRWVFEKFRILIYEKTDNIINTKSKNTYLFSFIVSIILFISYFLTNKAILVKNKKKKENLIILNFIFFIFFTCLFLFRPLGELRFSIFELLFVSLSFYFAFNKKFIPYLLSVVLCILNRESGLICSLFWFILNNNFLYERINFQKLKIFFDVKNILPIIIALLVFFLVNWDISKCFFNLNFFIPKEVHDVTLFNDFSNIFTGPNLNALFINNIFLVILLYIFYIKSFLQKKMLIILSLYLITFALFTPLVQYEIRIILIPFLITYLFEFIEKKKLI